MSNDRKKWVRERYGSIASGGQSECCSSATPCCGDQASQVAGSIGYESADLAAVPHGANLGLGCGNPIAIASIREGEIVVDLGSGAGFDVFLAAERVGETGKVIGVDMTPEMIQTAQRNAQSGGYTNVEFRSGDIESLPVEDCSVDLIISNCVLNLVPDKSRAFSEVYRVLKPGGRIAVADIVLDQALPKELMNDENAYCGCVSGAISRQVYLRGLADAGLEAITIESEMDAGDLLAGDCCGEGIPDLHGVVTSIKVTARKPGCCCCG